MDSGDVRRCLEGLAEKHGLPRFIRSDNGPEFISKALQSWEQDGGAQMRDTKPGSPWQNGNVESFHDKLRDEFLQMETFFSVAEARVLLEEWRVRYTEFLPPVSLDDWTPPEFAGQRLGDVSARPR